MVNIYAPQATDTISPDELELYDLIMAYRTANGLHEIPLSRALTTTAARHALDTVENQGGYPVGAPGENKAHGWSDAPYDGRNPMTYAAMWEAPQRLGTGYDVPGIADYGYEISIGYLGTNTPAMTAAVALGGWQSSPGHNDVILNRDVWSRTDLNWQAIGIGILGGVAHVWFGAMPDPTGTPFYGAATPMRMGGTGNDTLVGAPGTDLMIGRRGDDSYHVADAADAVIEKAGEGDDTVSVAVDDWAVPAHIETLRLAGVATRLTGTAAGETIWANETLGSTTCGGGGADVMWGGFGADILSGGAGDDTLLGVAGADRLEGGPGDDLFVVQDAAVLMVELAGEGRDTAWILADADWLLPANIEVVFLGGAAYRLTGGSGDDILLGNGTLANSIAGGLGHDQIYGGALADTLTGNGGNDAFIGGGGGDTFIGGAGDDTYVIGDPRDVVLELAGEGTDVALVVGGAWTMAAGVEVAYLSGTAMTLTGSAEADIMVGNGALGSTLSGGDGNDTIYGTIHADVISGGAGDDVAVVGGGADRLVFGAAGQAGGWGHDSYFGVGASAVLDFRGSGLVRADLAFTDLGAAIRLECALGVADFYAAPRAAIEGLTMLF